MALEKMDVSSTSITQRVYFIYFLYITNNNGPKTYPCRKLAKIFLHEDLCPLKTTRFMSLLSYFREYLASYHLYRMYAASKLNYHARHYQKFSKCLKCSSYICWWITIKTFVNFLST